MLHQINWPQGFVPGFTDNFASNEVIVAGLTVEQVWKYLVDTKYWPHYYENCSDIKLYDAHSTQLSAEQRFFFKTFGFPVEAKVTEFVAPSEEQPARISWHGWDGEPGTDTRLDVIHAWLIEALPDNRVRILTQETQNGVPAQQLARTLPNPMINGHQDWLNGLVQSAKNNLGV